VAAVELVVLVVLVVVVVVGVLAVVVVVVPVPPMPGQESAYATPPPALSAATVAATAIALRLSFILRLSFGRDTSETAALARTHA
jgi:hypothetical protein